MPSTTQPLEPVRKLSKVQGTLVVVILLIYVILAATFIGAHYERHFRDSRKRNQDTTVIDPRPVRRVRLQSPLSYEYIKSCTPLSLLSGSSTESTTQPQPTSSALEAQVPQSAPRRRIAFTELMARPGFVNIGDVEEGFIAQRRKASLRQ